MKLSDLNILEVGNTIQLAGAIYANGETVYLVPLPHELTEKQSLLLHGLLEGAYNGLEVLDMALPEWEVFIRQTDFLEVEVKETDAEGKVAKAILRKSQRQIDQGVSWRVWKRASYRCEYCGAEGVPLTVDHLVTWENGGPTVEENLAAACRRCNKTRGELPYDQWLRHPYYLKVSRNLIGYQQQLNEDRARTLSAIPRVKHIKSR